jgi:hypothetical protein
MEVLVIGATGRNGHGFPGGNGLSLEAILDREPRSGAQLFAELAAG